MPTEVIGLEDYRHYYDGCFGISDDKVVYVHEISPSPRRNEYTITGTAVIDGMWQPVQTSSNKITFPTPVLGYINIQDIAVLIKRLPLRQWKRGIYRGGLKIDFPVGVTGELAFFPNSFRNLAIGQSVITEAIFKRTYPTYQEAIRQIIQGDAACRAISPTILLSATNTDKIAVYYDNSLIGMVDRGNIVLSESSKMFQQELASTANASIGYI